MVIVLAANKSDLDDPRAFMKDATIDRWLYR